MATKYLELISLNDVTGLLSDVTGPFGDATDFLRAKYDYDVDLVLGAIQLAADADVL
jgi:hypothetical protein